MNISNRIAHFLAGSYTTPAFPKRPGISIPTEVKVNDISFYQDVNSTPAMPDFQVMKANGAKGVIIRAGQGSWEDEDFNLNYLNAKPTLPRGIYWFLDSRYSPVEQAKQLAAIVVRSGYPEMEIFADFEDNNNGPYSGWRHLSVFLTECESRIPKAALGIYTGYYYWLDHSPNPLTESASLAWFKKYPLWLAWYTSNQAYVKVPKPWDSLLLWQDTSHGDGKASGVESLNIDESIFNGTLAEFNARYLLDDTPTTPPPAIDQVVLKSVIPAPSVKTSITVTVNAKDYALEFTPDTVPVPPPVTPPPTTNLYRVASERWSELHGMTVPPNNGPLTQVMSGTTKGGKYSSPLGGDAQAFIKKWNTLRTWEKIIAPDYGPSQGVDPDTLRLKWNYLAWPSNASANNVVKVVEISGDWARVETLILPAAAGVSPSTTPWLFHKVCDNRGNVILVDGSPIICPLLGGAVWIPLRALIKV